MSSKNAPKRRILIVDIGTEQGIRRAVFEYELKWTEFNIRKGKENSRLTCVSKSEVNILWLLLLESVLR